MLICDTEEAWTQFLQYVKTRCSMTAYGNWFAPIRVLESTNEGITLEIPNIFVQEYLLSNYKSDLSAFLPVKANGEPAISFVIASPQKKAVSAPKLDVSPHNNGAKEPFVLDSRFNPQYRFENFIEGPSNQFVKSVAMGVAARPGQTYNPLFIHGGVGLGKTHILHSIGHYIREHHKKLRIHYTTTEAFINELVSHLREKSIKEMKTRYRSEIDVLLVDDIQFLQDRPNFQEEFACMFEALGLRGGQVVITSDKPPSHLKLSERTIGKMEGGLVVHMGIPDLETRVAILQYKAEQKGLNIPHQVAFYIAEHIYNNVRQLEGAVNRLGAHCRLLNLNITEELVSHALREMFHQPSCEKISVEQILKCVAAVFKVRASDLKGTVRNKEIVLPRQVAMYLAKEMINESLSMLGVSFCKTHSTILHACKNIEEKLTSDENLRSQIGMIKRNLSS
ncbi:MAG: chromosomal replication initiator protein DnaA [Chlamydiales bacterium]